MTVAVEGFVHSRAAPPEWQAGLDAITPRTSPLDTWLQLAWYPGQPYAPVGRWVIYEMTPRPAQYVDGLDVVPDYLRAGLEGPNPREAGKWVNGRWKSDSTVSLVQWQLYREHQQAVPLLYWIVQGERGGHPWRLAQKERMLLQALGRGGDVPNPGELPYAEVDERVFRQLRERDRLRKWRMSLDWQARTLRKTEAGIWVQREEEAQERGWAEAMTRWLESHIEDVVNDIPRRLLPQAREALFGDDNRVPLGFDNGQDIDALDQSMVDGAVNSRQE